MKNFVILCSLFFFGTVCFAQEKTVSSPKKTPSSSENKIEESKIITFPITTEKATDPNYQKNIQKSKVKQANLDREPVVIIKNDKYFTEKITELKRRIKEIHDNPDSPNVNIEKLGGLTDELSITEQDYNTYLETKK